MDTPPAALPPIGDVQGTPAQPTQPIGPLDTPNRSPPPDGVPGPVGPSQDAAVPNPLVHDLDWGLDPEVDPPANTRWPFVPRVLGPDLDRNTSGSKPNPDIDGPNAHASFEIERPRGWSAPPPWFEDDKPIRDPTSPYLEAALLFLLELVGRTRLGRKGQFANKPSRSGVSESPPTALENSTEESKLLGREPERYIAFLTELRKSGEQQPFLVPKEVISSQAGEEIRTLLSVSCFGRGRSRASFPVHTRK